MQKELFVLIPFWIVILIFLLKENKLIKQPFTFATDARYMRATLIMIGIGVVVRTVYLSYPHYIFVDEAMAAYDSWCLANYGVDQHLNSFPVYFKSWGTGQSVLYSYLSIPVIKLFGLSLPVFRTTMAIWSCISIIFFYYTLRATQKNALLTFLIIFIIVIAPWHISKSRGAIDCNLAADFIMIATSFFILGQYALKSKVRIFHYIAGAIFLGLSAYAYGVAWILLPTYAIMIYIYLLRKKRITNCQLIISVTILFIIVFPLVLFAYILFFGGDIIHLGDITIPTLNAGRHSSTTVFGQYDPLKYFISYLIHTAHLLIYGFELMKENGLPFFGHYYNIFGNIFIIYGFWKLRKKENRIEIDTIMLFWLLANIPIILIVEPSANHWNTLWFPVFYFCARGIYLFFLQFKKARKIIMTSYCILFISYLCIFFTTFQSKKKLDEFYVFLEFATKSGFDNIYIDYSIRYPIVLLVDPVSPYVYNKTRVVVPNFGMDIITKYSNINFSNFDEIDIHQKSVYMISNDKVQQLGILNKNYHSRKGSNYTLIWVD